MGKSGENGTFFSIDLEQTELEHILQRIDENLALRPIVRGQHGGLDGATPIETQPLLPSLPDLHWRLELLRKTRAPLFELKQNRVKNQLKRLLNLPIRIFGRRQVNFNLELLKITDLILTQIEGLRQHADYQAQLGQKAIELVELTHPLEAITRTLAEQQNDQHTRVEQLIVTMEGLASELQDMNKQFKHLAAEQQGQSDGLKRLADEQQGQGDWLKRLADEQQGQSDWLKRLAAEQQGQSDWLKRLADEQQGQSDWLQLLNRKHAMLALDVREGIAAQPAARAIPEPRILDLERYRQRITAMGEHIRVNLGCGEKPWPEYINVDFREMPDADVVADIRRLPFEPGTVAELASAHLVEHFREHQMRSQVLPYWKALLRPDGMLRIICPNWGAMLERLHDGRMSLPDFKLLTFGAQDYQGDDHFAMYTPETLTGLLAECGFSRCEILAADRMNGICPEMEVLGYL